MNTEELFTSVGPTTATTATTTIATTNREVGDENSGVTVGVLTAVDAVDTTIGVVDTICCLLDFCVIS